MDQKDGKPPRGRGRPRLYASDQDRWRAENARRKAAFEEVSERLKEGESELAATRQQVVTLNTMVNRLNDLLHEALDVMTDQQREKFVARMSQSGVAQQANPPSLTEAPADLTTKED